MALNVAVIGRVVVHHQHAALPGRRHPSSDAGGPGALLRPGTGEVR
jgi:hypothetical protein